MKHLIFLIILFAGCFPASEETQELAIETNQTSLFGVYKGMLMEELSLDVLLFPLNKENMYYVQVPEPDNRFDSYSVRLINGNQICSVRGHKISFLENLESLRDELYQDYFAEQEEVLPYNLPNFEGFQFNNEDGDRFMLGHSTDNSKGYWEAYLGLFFNSEFQHCDNIGEIQLELQ